MHRLNIDRKGNLFYHHSRDPNWDVNDYLVDLKSQLKTWRDVYWRVWGTVNYLPCSRCGETFACAELGSCSLFTFYPGRLAIGVDFKLILV